MARHNLWDEFETSQHRVNLGRRAAVAQAAHEEVRAVLKADRGLAASRLEDALIGSYARDTGIWPGKDVDILGKLTAQSIDTILPEDAYQMFHAALRARYAGRLTLQPRSIKIAFSPKSAPDRKLLESKSATVGDVFEFSVDVVPAVRLGDRWGIPRHDRDYWGHDKPADRWVETDPEVLTKLTRERNKDPRVRGQGAYVPTVKAIRQIRKHLLGRHKPSALYYEFILHEGFLNGAIVGDTWADLTVSALAHVAGRLNNAAQQPLCDPVLLTPYQPAPEPLELAAAAQAFGKVASNADRALGADRCAAGAAWRQVFGQNGRPPFDWVFSVPTNCREDGSVVPVATGANPLRGSDEARGFGAA